MSVCEPATSLPVAELPVGGEVSEQLWQRVVEGQPMVLLHDGRPAAVVIDLDSWGEIEALVGEGEGTP